MAHSRAVPGSAKATMKAPPVSLHSYPAGTAVAGCQLVGWYRPVWRRFTVLDSPFKGMRLQGSRVTKLTITDYNPPTRHLLTFAGKR